MARRNNSARASARAANSSEAAVAETTQFDPSTQLAFVTPTELVELPSQGKFYDAGHPLQNKDTVEIKYMTAKEEDILVSKTLIKKGLVLDRLVESVLIDKTVKASDLLIGDKNAVLIASRITGYGALYETKVTCPVCLTVSDYAFDLQQSNINFGGTEDVEGVEITTNNTFVVEMPITKASVEVKFLTGKDETKLAKMVESKKKHRLPGADAMITNQFKSFIVSVNGSNDRTVVASFVENMPALDSRHLRSTYQKLTPNIDLTQEFACDTCSYESDMEVPLTADFFWPRA